MSFDCRHNKDEGKIDLQRNYAPLYLAKGKDQSLADHTTGQTGKEKNEMNKVK